MNEKRENKIDMSVFQLQPQSMIWNVVNRQGGGWALGNFVCLWVWTDRIKNNIVMWFTHSVAQLQNTVDIPLISIETIIKQKHSRTNTNTHTKRNVDSLEFGSFDKFAWPFVALRSPNVFEFVVGQSLCAHIHELAH